jgi:hypothetical protein
LLPGFLIQIILAFELLPKRKVVPFEIIYHHIKFGKVWTLGRFWFVISKFEP